MNLNPRYPIFLAIVLLSGLIPLFGQASGKLNGYVKDALTQQVIEGAGIVLEGTSFRTTTDSNGYFRIDGITPGSYAVKASMTGYASKTEFNVQITSGNANSVNFLLQPEGQELKGATVKAKSFRKIVETPLSINSLSAQEVKSFPGANFDIVKVAQSLPGVSGSVGFRNDLIIRGGAPNENVYYLDGIEVPNINHFATQGSGGGPAGMLNVAFIDEVTLSSSAFHARYDNPLSGVLQFRQKNGNRDRTQGNFRLSATEMALTLEGPLSKDKRWTYIASVRRSYLQLLFKLIDLPFLPNYWDYQYKVTFKPNKKDEISLIGLNAIDDFSFNAPKIDTATQSDFDIQNKLFILNGVAKYTQYSATGGVNWKHLLKRGYTNLAVSSNVLRNGITKYDDNDESDPSKLRIRLNSYEWEFKARYEVNQFYGGWKYSYGVNAAYCRYTNDFSNKIFIQPLNLNKIILFNTSLDFFKGGVFGNISRSFLDGKLSTALGIRTDVNSFTKNGMNPLGQVSPRFNVTYNVTKRLNLNASVGKYYKILPYTLLGFKDSLGNYANKNNKYISSMHYTAGIEFLKSAGTRVTLEGFYKVYGNYPVSLNEGISLANLGGGFGFVGNEAVSDLGKGRTYGVEFCLQQKLTKHFYGILSYTWFVSEFTGKSGKYIPSAWDNRHLMTFTGGYKFKKNLELGTRWRFLGSAPYTPYDTVASLYSYKTTGSGVLDYNAFNSLRFSAYFAIDIRLDKKWNFKKWTLDLFMDIQNVTGRSNPSQPGFTYRRDVNNPANFIDKNGNSVPLSQVNPMNVQYLILGSNSGSRTPSIGVVVEF